jgi:hypothetical protein
VVRVGVRVVAGFVVRVRVRVRVGFGVLVWMREATCLHPSPLSHHQMVRVELGLGLGLHTCIQLRLHHQRVRVEVGVGVGGEVGVAHLHPTPLAPSAATILRQGFSRRLPAVVRVRVSVRVRVWVWARVSVCGIKVRVVWLKR